MSKNPGSSKLSPDLLKEILNKLVLRPRLKRAARETGLHPSTLFSYIQRAQNGDPDPALAALSWLGVIRRFDEHVNIARKLSVVAMDHSARDQAINGWSEKKFHDGKPVWKRDPKLEADALDPEFWRMMHGDRPITDTYARDVDRGLIQEEIQHPPNPALLTKMLASLAPDVYAERTEVLHTHQGGVWIENDKPKQLTAPVDADLQETFAMTEKPDPAQHSSNVLAIPARCQTAEEFDAKFRKNLVREVTLFRDATGTLQPPLDDDVIVRGSWQDEEFTKAGIAHKTVSAEDLVAQGYQNNFLRVEVEPPPSKHTVNRVDAALASLEKMPDGDLKRDVFEKLNAIRNGKTNPLPKIEHGHDANPDPKAHQPDEDMRDDKPFIRPKMPHDQPGRPPRPERGIGHGPDPHNVGGYKGYKVLR